MKSKAPSYVSVVVFWICAVIACVLALAVAASLTGCTAAPTATQPADIRPLRVIVQPTPTERPLTCVTTGKVNIRSGGGMGYPVVAWAWDGEELTIIGGESDQDGWLQIRTVTGAEGFIYGPLCPMGGE